MIFVWREMRTELISLRSLTQKYACAGVSEVLVGDVRIDTVTERSNGVEG